MSASPATCFICGQRLGTEVGLKGRDAICDFYYCVECSPFVLRAGAVLALCHRWNWRHPSPGENPSSLP